MEVGKQYTINNALLAINAKVREHGEDINTLQEYVRDLKDFKKNLTLGAGERDVGFLLRSGNKFTLQDTDDRLSFMEPIVTKMNAIIKTNKMDIVRDDINFLLDLSLKRKNEYDELKLEIEKIKKIEEDRKVAQLVGGMKKKKKKIKKKSIRKIN